MAHLRLAVLMLCAALPGCSIAEDTPQDCRNEWLVLTAAAFSANPERAGDGLPLLMLGLSSCEEQL
jgi:hypothetical protein